MNRAHPGNPELPSLVEIIELKWLLAGEGVHLHVERMLADTEYAGRALKQADASDNPSLRQVAQMLRLKFGLGAA